MSEIKKLLFSLPVQTMSSVMARYNEKGPEPLNRQFPERLSKDKATESQKGRERARTELLPSGKLLLWLHVSLSVTAYMCVCTIRVIISKANSYFTMFLRWGASSFAKWAAVTVFSSTTKQDITNMWNMWKTQKRSSAKWMSTCPYIRRGGRTVIFRNWVKLLAFEVFLLLA